MIQSDGNTDPSPDYARDIEIFDHVPWEVRGPVDELIDLQRLAFGADLAGNYTQFGRITMQMSTIEHSIGNHSEAAAYANEAVGAFTGAGNNEEALGAQATLAKEYRTLLSPDLALGTLEDIIKLRTHMSAEKMRGSADRVLDVNIDPVLRLARSFTATYAVGRIAGPTNLDDPEYPSVYLPKGPRPSSDTTERLVGALDELLQLPLMVESKKEMDALLRHLHGLYRDLGHYSLSMSRSERNNAQAVATLLAKASFRLTFIGIGEGADDIVEEFQGETLINLTEEIMRRTPGLPRYL